MNFNVQLGGLEKFEKHFGRVFVIPTYCKQSSIRASNDFYLRHCLCWNEPSRKETKCEDEGETLPRKRIKAERSNNN